MNFWLFISIILVLLGIVIFIYRNTLVIESIKFEGDDVAIIKWSSQNGNVAMKRYFYFNYDWFEVNGDNLGNIVKPELQLTLDKARSQYVANKKFKSK